MMYSIFTKTTQSKTVLHSRSAQQFKAHQFHRFNRFRFICGQWSI